MSEYNIPWHGEMCRIQELFLINESGNAVNPILADNQYNIGPDVVFVRNDGWKLGAPIQFAEVAHRMWENNWKYFYRTTYIG